MICRFIVILCAAIIVAQLFRTAEVIRCVARLEPITQPSALIADDRCPSTGFRYEQR